MAKNTAKTYSEMRLELEAAMGRLESGELDVDNAVKEYEKIQKLINAMEKHLKTAQNSIKHLKK